MRLIRIALSEEMNVYYNDAVYYHVNQRFPTGST